MASKAQLDFFKQLLDEKALPAGSPDPGTLTTQFEAQSVASASNWIEKMRALPKKDANVGENTAPPF